MKRNILCLFLVSILSINIYAQKSILSGKVEDATNGEALIGVNIIVNELEGMGTTTELDGT